MQDIIDAVLSKVKPSEKSELESEPSEMQILTEKAKKVAARKMMSALKSDNEDDFLAAYNELKESLE